VLSPGPPRNARRLPGQCGKKHTAWPGDLSEVLAAKYELIGVNFLRRWRQRDLRHVRPTSGHGDSLAR